MCNHSAVNRGSRAHSLHNQKWKGAYRHYLPLSVLKCWSMKYYTYVLVLTIAEDMLDKIIHRIITKGLQGLIFSKIFFSFRENQGTPGGDDILAFLFHAGIKLRVGFGWVRNHLVWFSRVVWFGCLGWQD